MHKSLFSYNLSRPYPFRWFTWVTVIGGIGATVFFSVLNTATAGYLLSVVYTTNPNGTLAQPYWFQSRPWSFVNKLTASCQSQNIPINTQLFTTQLGLLYTLGNVWTEGSNGNPVIYPSLTYLNNTITDCSVQNIELDAENTNKEGNAAFWAWEESRISALVTCSIQNGLVPVKLNLTVVYQPVSLIESATVNGGLGYGGSGFLQLDNQTKASVWWGQQLMWLWYYNVAEALSVQDIELDAEHTTTISRARIYLKPSGLHNIESYDFFSEVVFWFYMGDGSLIANTETFSSSLGGFSIGFQLDHLAKSFYSTILADLGQSEGPNIVASSALLQHFLEGASSKTQIPAYSGLASEAYDALKSTIGPLNITESTFYAQYACEVPHRKDIGTLIITVIVADLVFLQALWKVLNLSALGWLNRTNDKANFCEGCSKAITDQDPFDVALLPVTSDPRFPQGEDERRPNYNRYESEESTGSALVVPRKPVASWKYERLTDNQQPPMIA